MISAIGSVPAAGIVRQLPFADSPARVQSGRPPADQAAKGKSPAGPGELNDEERKAVAELRKRDREVRQHERAHAAAGGQFTGAPSFEFARGPDGRQYAINGEVAIDASPVEGDPKATIAKMAVVKAAALAPAKPSGQDRSVAAAADAAKLAAQAELNAQKSGDPEATGDGLARGDVEQAIAAYQDRADQPPELTAAPAILDLVA